MSMSYNSVSYNSGFGNEFATEALQGALPEGQNSPQRCPYGLYAEQFSGTPFTAPRAHNRRSWLYRIRPSVRHGKSYTKIDVPEWKSAPCVADHTLPPAQFRWGPVPIPDTPLTFVSGMRTMTTAGDVHGQSGMAAHLYLVTAPMVDEYLMNSDGEMLIVPQHGGLELATELGVLHIQPGEIAIIPRGLKLRVSPLDGTARGYVCENYGALLTLPERGPIGANALANPRDFLSPLAAYEDTDQPGRMIMKWGGAFYATDLDHSPLDVVAWHGNHAPYKYDLNLFCPVGAVLFDHPDPSIFTVLTAPTDTVGTANIDFVIFPERWMVAENTFRPPWYHVNVMSEFMGLIHGVYDAKPDGFAPGGMSLHNAMLPHGPDHNAFEAGSTEAQKPVRQSGTLAFMFETKLVQHLTAYAATLETRQADYAACWDGVERKFDPAKR
ncbi:MAG: homogentisate 1,2-dioxygenase [Pseudomonadota bacterium]